MKQPLLFFLFISLSISVFSQVQGPPAPCGFFIKYSCDDNEDGFAEFNLVNLFPFETFCREDKGNPQQYHPIVFYETEGDMYNEINPIVNPNSYINTSNPQTIYYRANAINTGGAFEYITAENRIEVKRLIAPESTITIYDDNSDGFSTFDLTSIDLFCGTNDENDYTVTYHELEADANSGTNTIANPSAFQNTKNPHYIFVRAVHNITSYVETTSLILKVLFAEATSPGNIFDCDDDDNGQDAIHAQDLTRFNSIILGKQDPNNFTVSFYSTQNDAENKTNQLPSIYSASDQETVYARVDENTRGSYAITSFSFTIHKETLVEPLGLYEICDEDSDGKAVFDLASIRNKIIRDANNYQYFDISFHLDESDTFESFIPDQDSYTNVTNPQTIYVDVEDWGISFFGCYTIIPLELVVKDCSVAGVIEINAFYDANTDTTFDNEEINFINGTLTYVKNNDGIEHELYSSTGIFNIISDDEANTYDISYSIYDEFQQCYNLVATSYENISVANGSKVNYDFPITKTKDCSDIAVYLVSNVTPRPGFDYKNRLVIQNKGLETVTSGSVEFVYDPVITFNNVSYVDAGNSITNTSTGFILNFANLEPNHIESVLINMNVPIPTNLGTLITNTATYSVTDLLTENNISVLSEIVIGSYDPNDILESHGPEILHSSFDSEDYLFYTVRFQNVGTADAINVSIDNTLNPKLDKSTIQMLSSSHTNVFTRVDDQLNWQFDNIHLPSESMDEPASHGYVFYKIKPTPGYKVADIIPNTAEIYFDFNPAVVTNTFETAFVATLSNKNYNDSEFSIFPNPTNNVVTLKFNKNTSNTIQITVYDIQGKSILNSKRALMNNETQLNISELKSGLYFIKVFDGFTEITKKLLKN